MEKLNVMEKTGNLYHFENPDERYEGWTNACFMC